MTRRISILLSMALCGLTGCGGGHVELVALNYRSIDPPAPRIGRIGFQRCYWWTNADNELCVAMERRFYPLLGKWGEFRFQMSLVLERPPAGKARNYTVAERELRARFLLGPTQIRFTSAAGIVAVYREPGNRLRGSFRLLARRVVSRWLGGWNRPSSYLLLGTFHAVHDEQRGRQIAAATETAGWERNTRAPSSRPAASQPTSAPVPHAESVGSRNKPPPASEGRIPPPPAP